jgi:hypothetical protein
MRVDSQIDRDSLAAFGVEVARLLYSGQIEALADRFGYALALGRAPAAAIREDLRSCLSELGAAALATAVVDPNPEVKYFAPNSPQLFAVVECLLLAENGRKLLVELIVAGDVTKHITLEQISAAA